MSLWIRPVHTHRQAKKKKTSVQRSYKTTHDDSSLITSPEKEDRTKTTMAASDETKGSDAPKQRTQPHLMPQDAKTVDPSKLSALTPEVVSVLRIFPTTRERKPVSKPLTCSPSLSLCCTHFKTNNIFVDFTPSNYKCWYYWSRGSRKVDRGKGH